MGIGKLFFGKVIKFLQNYDFWFWFGAVIAATKEENSPGRA